MNYILNYFQPIILGAIQGLTEFVPISSSGHLVIVRQLFGWKDQGALFDAVLHLATVIAILIYFRHDWLAMMRSLSLKSESRTPLQYRRLFILLMVATIPAVLVGLLFSDMIESHGRGLVVVASLMVFAGLMFWLIEKIAVPRKNLNRLTFFDALGIGLAQAAAMLPGISRSGFTIIGGMYFGLKREDAAKYAFLLAVPALILAGGYGLVKMEFGSQAVDWIGLGVGSIVSLLSSLAAIAMMMKLLKIRRLFGFAGYLIIVGLALLGLVIAKVHLPLTF